MKIKNPHASALGKASVEARRKKLGKKFNEAMKELRKKGKQKLCTPPLDERS